MKVGDSKHEVRSSQKLVNFSEFPSTFELLYGIYNYHPHFFTHERMTLPTNRHLKVLL